MKKVAIVQKALAQYRVEFHNLLKGRLEEEDIELTLIYSKYKTADALKKDEVDLVWGTCVPGKVITLGPLQLLWQSCLPLLRDNDLVIVEQANKNLLNYLLLVKRAFSKIKFAYWGHGANRQINQTDLRNKFKKIFLNQCDWWFAYTGNVKKFLIINGYPSNRITNVQNAIDTKFLSKTYSQIGEAEVRKKLTERNITSRNVAIYCGGIYKEKRISFLISSCQRIRKQIPDFELIVIGAGPDASLLEQAVSENNWIHYLGPRFGAEKITWFKASKVFLMPGLVGLAILDSFALQTPMVTTDFPFHSPEIEYLENGINGIITDNDETAYADAVINLLKDDRRQETLIKGCIDSATRYSIEQMVENFAQGILKCLGQKSIKEPITTTSRDTSLLLTQD